MGEQQQRNGGWIARWRERRREKARRAAEINRRGKAAQRRDADRASTGAGLGGGGG